MDRYERFWLRKYAVRVLAGGVAVGRLKRPSPPVWAWLSRNAALLGVREPLVDYHGFECGTGQIDDAWASFKAVEGAGYSRRRILDRMIAAQALVHRATLVTTNAGDFRDVPGLELLEW